MVVFDFESPKGCKFNRVCRHMFPFPLLTPAAPLRSTNANRKLFVRNR